MWPFLPDEAIGARALRDPVRSCFATARKGCAAYKKRQKNMPLTAEGGKISDGIVGPFVFFIGEKIRMIITHNTTGQKSGGQRTNI